jgi:hypothetical protein
MTMCRHVYAHAVMLYFRREHVKRCCTRIRRGAIGPSCLSIVARNLIVSAFCFALPLEYIALITVSKDPMACKPYGLMTNDKAQ